MTLTKRVTSDGAYIPYTPPSVAVVGGDVIVQGEMVGVADVDIAVGKLGNLSLRGSRDFPKAVTSGSGMAAGAKVYWDVADQEATTDADTGTNKMIGFVVTVAADSDTTVLVVRASE